MSLNKEQVKAALVKEAAYGKNLDLNTFDDNDAKHVEKIEDLSAGGKGKLAKVGIELNEAGRSATFVQVDNAAVKVDIKKDTPLVMMNTGAAAEKYPELVEKYWWKAVKPDTDKYTAKTALEKETGYFIHVQKGVKISAPLQACVFMSHEDQLQRVHNVIILEEGAELNIISGCASDPAVDKGVHIGISEFFIGKNAKMTFTMIHSWGKNVAVRPRTVAIVEEGGLYMSNYVCMDKVADVQMYPTTRLVGKGAVSRLNSILVAPEGSHLDIGGKAILEVPGTRAEIITRSISTGGTIINRGLLQGMSQGVKAHLECNGLMLNDKGRIYAIPELDAHTGNSDLSHEAAVGRVNPEEIEYLMARGLSEEEATATIVRGFLNINIEGLPKTLEEKITKTLDTFSYTKGMYANFGSTVTVVQDGEVFLPREDAEVAAVVLKSLEDRGIVILRSTKINSVQEAGNKAQVLVTTPEGDRVLDADAILVATGRRPNVEGLGLEKAGVVLTERGAVKTDARLQTSVPHIYAMGDVVGGLQFTYVSLDDYRIVSSQLLGKGERTTANRGAVPYSVFLDPPFSRVGLSEKEALEKGYKIKIARLPAAAIPKAQVLQKPVGLLKAIIDADTDLILGAHLFCEESYEIINLLKLAIDAKVPYTVLRDNIYTHPTMTEGLNDLFASLS